MLRFKHIQSSGDIFFFQLAKNEKDTTQNINLPLTGVPIRFFFYISINSKVSINFHKKII